MKQFIFDQAKYGGDGLEELIEIQEEYGFDLEEFSLDQQELLEHKLLSIVDSYPQFISAYQELYSLFQAQERWIEQELLIFRVYSIVKSLVLDKTWQFPEQMYWLSEENRPLIRFLFYGADLQWSLGCVEEAKFIYMGLLNSNPYDNLGVRFVLLAICEQMEYEEYYEKFDGEEVSQEQFDWFDKKASMHKEFEVFFKRLEGLQ